MFRCVCQRLLQCKSLPENVIYSRHLYCSYRSKLSLENLYPDSDQNHIAHVSFKHTASEKTESTSEDEPFSGYIPIGDVEIRCSRSSGPGGQNVNKVNSKVEVRFNVDKAEWIPDWIKPKLKEQEQGRLNKEGELIIRSEKTRKQMLNQADCFDRIRNMIYKASIKPKEPTKEELEKIAERKEIADKKRLEEKRRNSLRRKMRKDRYY